MLWGLSLWGIEHLFHSICSRRKSPSQIKINGHICWLVFNVCSGHFSSILQPIYKINVLFLSNLWVILNLLSISWCVPLVVTSVFQAGIIEMGVKSQKVQVKTFLQQENCWTLTKSKSLYRSASKGLQWSSLEWKWESSGRSCLCFPSPSWSTRPSSSTSSSSTTTMAGSLLRTILPKRRWSYEFLIGHWGPETAVQITNHWCFFSVKYIFDVCKKCSLSYCTSLRRNHRKDIFNNPRWRVSREDKFVQSSSIILTT